MRTKYAFLIIYKTFEKDDNPNKWLKFIFLLIYVVGFAPSEPNQPLFIYLFNLYIYLFVVCVYACVCVKADARHKGLSGARVIGSCELPIWVQDLNLGPLKE